jgi:hypothetical protein
LTKELQIAPKSQGVIKKLLFAHNRAGVYRPDSLIFSSDSLFWLLTNIGIGEISEEI